MSDRTRKHDASHEHERRSHDGDGDHGPIHAHGHEHGRAHDSAPRVDPQYYRKALYSVLTKADGQKDAQKRLAHIIEKIETSLSEKKGRPLGEAEKHLLQLQSFRDMRNALMGVALELATEKSGDSETHLRRAGNVSYLQWSIEKQILCLHWNITNDELTDRQLKSGRKMSRYLSDCLENEGLL